MAKQEQSKEERLIRLLKDKGKVILKARFGKTQGPLVICPVIDPVTRTMRGVKTLSEEDRKKEVRVVDEYTTRKLFDGIEFNAKSVVDTVDWAWIVYNKEVVASRREAWQDETALFYVDDYEEETRQKTSLRELKLEASMAVKKLSQDSKADLMRLFGVHAGHLEPYEITEFLYDKAENFPEQTLSRIRDEHVREKIFIMDLLEKKILSRDPETAVYLYGEMKLGTTMESLIAWLKDAQNQDLIREMRLSLTA
jgi:hypothetical protein